jgi:beta-galactosidase/beta-glucuronidase
MSTDGSTPRPEYPRPVFRRERWANLNGGWAFAFDDDDVGRARRWQDVRATELSDTGGDSPFDRRIVVPFSYQTPASGIEDPTLHDTVWYARTFDASGLAGPDERLLLHIGAADRYAWVWVNGRLVAAHEGGYTPITADITDAVGGDGDVVVVRVSDPPGALDVPRGKQFWRDRSEDVFYRGTTGIWQTVWLEPVARAAVDDLGIVPLLDDAAVELTVRLTPAAIGGTVAVHITYDGRTLVDDTLRITGHELRRRWRVTEAAGLADATVIEHRGVATWSPRRPRLHDLRLEVRDAHGDVTDVVESYFGMRKIEAHDGQVLLNDRPLYQRLVLDQGYFPDGGYTATSDEALRRDIELAKQMGFNGARKHQKVEDPRWLYWADRLGFLVWEEMPSGYRWSDRYVRRVTTEWQDIIARDRNHPCVIVWTPVNESWGVPGLRGDPDPQQVAFLRALYHLTTALDPTRLVVSNDGWEHVTTDLCTIHDYGDADGLRTRFADRDSAIEARPLHRSIYVRGAGHRGEPLIVSELGGIRMTPDADDVDTWGFHTVPDADALLDRYGGFLEAATASDAVVGFCWTQLTDVEQEANGLLRADRTPKIDPAAVRQVTERARARRSGRV